MVVVEVPGAKTLADDARTAQLADEEEDTCGPAEG